MPILSEVSPGSPLETQDCHRGAIVSRRGAKTQRWHMDAEQEHCEVARRDPAHRLYNIFVPLIDIESDGLGTQFQPGSHLWDHCEPLDDNEPAVELEAPACPAGGIIIFDHRLIVRGVANEERERAIVCGVVSSGGAVRPSDFPPAPRIRDATAEHIRQLPFFTSHE